MSNSSLICYTRLSPNYSKRTKPITKITPHHTACVASVESLCNSFANPKRQASANYVIGSDGRIGLCVEENKRAWTSGNADNDQQAITIEVSNDVTGGEWHVSDKALNSLINLCVDICKRNNIKLLNYTGNANGNLTMHCMFQATACPGPYLKSKFPYIASTVNNKLNPPKISTPIVCSKSNTEIASEVIGGKWGNGQDRINRLRNAGYNYTAVQSIVDMMLKKPVQNNAPFKKTNETIAREVIQGKWGNGLTRRIKLSKAGYNYTDIQMIVNILLQK